VRPPAGQDLPRPDQLALGADDTELARLAARTVRRLARDADDEHLLLDALGLHPATPKEANP
jgi:hypothetical protein